MAGSAYTDDWAEATQRLGSGDVSLAMVNLFDKHLSKEVLDKLADNLLACPDGIKQLDIGKNQLTDDVGEKLARFLAASRSVEVLCLAFNELTDKTYLAIADALRTNTSLRGLIIHDNKPSDKKKIDAAFVDALRANVNRPESLWRLYTGLDFDNFTDLDFNRLREQARAPPAAATEEDKLRTQCQRLQAELDATRARLHETECSLRAAHSHLADSQYLVKQLQQEVESLKLAK